MFITDISDHFPRVTTFKIPPKIKTKNYVTYLDKTPKNTETSLKNIAKDIAQIQFDDDNNITSLSDFYSFFTRRDPY